MFCTTQYGDNCTFLMFDSGICLAILESYGIKFLGFIRIVLKWINGFWEMVRYDAF